MPSRPTDSIRPVKVTSKEVIHFFVLGYAQKLSWVCGKMDHELNWISGTDSGTGVYVGDLNGTKGQFTI